MMGSHDVLVSSACASLLRLTLLLAITWVEPIPSCPKGCFCDTWKVNCRGKQFNSFPSPIPWPTRELILAHNNLTSLLALDLSYLSELVYLDCSHNHIELEMNFIFTGIVKLMYLDLSFNNLTHITHYAFSQLSMLLLLNLSGNPNLIDITSSAFYNNPMLRALDVSGCGLVYFDTGVLRNLLNLHTVGISNNPWMCNCNTLDFIRWITDSAHLFTNTSSDITCHEPEDFHGWNMKDSVLEKLHFQCSVHFETSHYVIIAMISFSIFCGGTFVALLVGICSVLYYHPELKMDSEFDDEEYRMTMT